MSHFETPGFAQLPIYAPQFDRITPVPDGGGAPDFDPGAPAGSLGAEQPAGSGLARRVRRGLGRVSLAVSVLAGGSFAVDACEPEPAGAETAIVRQVYGTSGEGLYLHPGAPDVNAPISDLLSDGTNALTYNQRGWTYSQKDHTWLQQERDSTGNYPNHDMTAYLVHFRGEDELNLH